MSLFETFSAMSKQHAENSGSYTFENPLKGNAICGHTCGCTTAEQCEFNKPEPAPTVSLYNLLDHSPSDLVILLRIILKEIKEMEPDKFLAPNVYTSLCAWARIIETAIKEQADKDLDVCSKPWLVALSQHAD